jgi:Flp pilus assembly protein TadD
LDEAIRQYQEALRLNPGYALAHNNLGYALGQKGQLDEAIRQYQKAISLDPGCALAHTNLARALETKNAPAGR